MDKPLGTPDQCGYCGTKGRMVFVSDGRLMEQGHYGGVWACNSPECAHQFYDLPQYCPDCGREIQADGLCHGASCY